MALNINGTTGISGVDASVSAPALTGTDSNTGISFPAADTIKFSTNGVERMEINNNAIIATGHIIQVAFATTTTAVQNTSTSTYADSGLSASITLLDASSKVLVMVSQPFRMANASSGQNGGAFRFVRNGSNIDNVQAYLYYNAGTGMSTKFDYDVHASHILDTPGSGTHTYKTQTIAYGSNSEVYSQYGGISRMTLLEVGG
jgi:hypothetical protein